jgi:hypothetical protein
MFGIMFLFRKILKLKIRGLQKLTFQILNSFLINQIFFPFIMAHSSIENAFSFSTLDTKSWFWKEKIKNVFLMNMVLVLL